MAILQCQFSQQMSVATDSPVNPSSSDDDDDFAALIEAELESDSADDSPDIVDDDSVEDYDVAHQDRIKRRKVMMDQDSCPHRHPDFFKNMCIRCGERVDTVSGVAFGYIHKDLRLGSDEISLLRNADVRSLLRRKKLYLVLDLDHTLLNSTRLDDMSSEEKEYLYRKTDSLSEISKGSLFRLDKIRMMTKRRPFVRKFLQEVSSMFEMYIYTMGDRAYALEMAKLLDPESSYFHSRVISKDDCTQRHQKGLDVVLGQESAVLILDDTQFVWKKHKDNLILMERYHFFSSSCRQFHLNHKSLSESESDENELDGALARVLRVLKTIHAQFFDNENGDNYAAKDVRPLISHSVSMLSCPSC